MAIFSPKPSRPFLPIEDCFLDLEIGYNHIYGKIPHLIG